MLLVDDVPALAKALRRTLHRRLGITLVDVIDPSRAVDCARDHKPQVALVDYFMPAMRGSEVIRGLREEFPKLTIGAISGSMTAKVEAECIQAGADWTLVKGDVDDLVVQLVRCGAREQEYSLQSGLPFETIKKVVFRREVEAHGGNISAAARSLEVDRNTVKRVLENSREEE